MTSLIRVVAKKCLIKNLNHKYSKNWELFGLSWLSEKTGYSPHDPKVPGSSLGESKNPHFCSFYKKNVIQIQSKFPFILNEIPLNGIEVKFHDS